MEQNKRGRGRPIQYEPDRAVAGAMDVFWTHGLDAASLDELGSAMGMNRPSMRAAFGDKADLFAKSVELYEKLGHAALEEILQREQPVRDNLRDAFISIMDKLLEGKAAPRGCFMFTVATAETVKSAHIRELVATGMGAMDTLFRLRLERAIADGELAPSAPAAQLAKVATGLVQALSVRARAKDPRDALLGLIDTYITLICGPVPQKAEA